MLCFVYLSGTLYMISVSPSNADYLHYQSVNFFLSGNQIKNFPLKMPEVCEILPLNFSDPKGLSLLSLSDQQYPQF